MFVSYLRVKITVLSELDGIEPEELVMAAPRYTVQWIYHHRQIYNPLDTPVMQGYVIARGPSRHCSPRSRRARSSEKTGQYRVQSGSRVRAFFMTCSGTG
jgi:hypothetical protein